MSSTSSRKMNNFKEAWTSLFPGKSTTAQTPEAQAISQPAASQEENTSKAPDKKGVVKTTGSNMAKSLHSDSSEVTVISKDTEINGSITSKANIKITGTVKGNITSDANVIISGTVEGDISGESIALQSGSITGNITSKTTVTVSERSMIEGDIKCGKFNLNGNVKGNVQAYSSATLGSIAVIQGNLTSQYLSIEEGATVDGAIKVSRDRESPMGNMFQIGLNKPIAAECI